MVLVCNDILAARGTVPCKKLFLQRGEEATSHNDHKHSHHITGQREEEAMIPHGAAHQDRATDEDKGGTGRQHQTANSTQARQT